MFLVPVALLLSFATIHASEPPDYAKDILPIFQRNCVPCHNLQTTEGGLNLESFEAMRKGGDSGESYVIGKAAESSLVRRVRGEEEIMPPEGNNVGAKPLIEEEIALLVRWIEGGALAGEMVLPKTRNWKQVPESLKPIYSIDATTDGQYMVVGRGSLASVYRWGADGPLQQTFLVDPAVGQSLPQQAEGPEPLRATHLDLVQSVAIDPLGTRIATGGFRELKIWRRPTEKIDNRLTEMLRGSTYLASSPDGTLIAKGTHAPAIEIIDANRSRTIARWDANSPIASLAWGGDNQKLIVQLEDASLSLLTLSEADANGNRTIALSSARPLDSVHQLRGSGISPKIAKALSGETPEPHLKDITDLASSDAHLFTADANGTVHIYSHQDGNLVKSIAHGGPIVSLLVDREGTHLFTIGRDGISKGWNVETGEILWENRLNLFQEREIAEAETRLARHKAKVERDAARVPALENSHKVETEKLTALKTRREEVSTSLKSKSDAFEAQVAQVAEGEAAVTAANAALEEVKAKLEQAQKELETRKQNLANAEQAKKEEATKLESADKNVAAADQATTKAAGLLAEFQKKLESDRAELATFESSTQELKSSMQSIPATKGVLTQGETAIATVRENGDLHVIRADIGRTQTTISGSIPAPDHLVATNSDILLATHSDGRSIGWDISNRWELERTIGNLEESLFSDRITALSFSHDGTKLAVGSGPPGRSGDLHLLDVGTGKILKDWEKVHGDTIFAVKFSPDDQILATGGADKLVRLHSMMVNSEEQEVAPRTFEGHTHHVLGLAWHEDGHLLASSSADNTVKIWNVDQGQAERTVVGFGKEVTGIAFMGRTDQLVTSCSDHRVRIHRGSDGRLIREIGGAADSLFSVFVIARDPADPKTAMVISGGQEGVTWVWQAEDGKVLRELK